LESIAKRCIENLMNTDISFQSLPEDLRRRYLARRCQDALDCSYKLLSLDWAYFERLGHQLKGNAPSFGYQELSEIALRIESFAQKRNLVELEATLEEFKSWVAHQKS
jgi:HPt (histidine-containing phosphotransfer) domain-containing protein